MSETPSYAELLAENQALKQQLAVLLEELTLLKAQIAQTSQTSSQPPSRDKPWKSKSERTSSGKPTGGQVGHPGKTLKMSEHVEEVVVLPLTGLCLGQNGT